MKKPSLKLVLPLVATVILTWVFREPLRQQITKSATLANDAPPPEVVADMIEHAANPHEALLAAWKSGKVVHREVAIRSLSHVLPTGEPLPAEFNSLLLSAALDPDMNVRESAFGILHERNHPALPALAAGQLRDFDQQVRVLGLNYLKYASPAIGVPTVIPLLDDPDPFIVTTTLKLLENWSGEKFGVKLSETAEFENEKTGLKEFREGSFEKARLGAERAKAWWQQHQGEFPPVRLDVPAEAYAAQHPVPAGDFQLRTLEGKKVRFSDFRGRVVLVNFWTTWCTACVSEMPELIALQKSHPDNLVIIGVTLDFVPDDDGDHPVDPKEIPQKIARTVSARGINYPILLDKYNEVGGRFNGGELPTTIIVDAQGNVRRRFVGARSLPVFEAMIAEASRPARSGLPLSASRNIME
jgi:thiol-disulfide isomerase/thioredoxin